MTLDDEDIEAIAERVAELLAPGPRVGLVTPKQLAREFGVSVEYVYEHADELGVTRLGKGKRPRQRFDVQRARDALAALQTTRAAPRAGGTATSGPPPQSPRTRVPSARAPAQRGLGCPRQDIGTADAPTPPGPAPEVLPMRAHRIQQAGS